MCEKRPFCIIANETKYTEYDAQSTQYNCKLKWLFEANSTETFESIKEPLSFGPNSEHMCVYDMYLSPKKMNIWFSVKVRMFYFAQLERFQFMTLVWI